TAANLLAQNPSPDDTSTPEVSDKAAAGIAAPYWGCSLHILDSFSRHLARDSHLGHERRETPPVAECDSGHGAGMDSGYDCHWVDCPPCYATKDHPWRAESVSRAISDF